MVWKCADPAGELERRHRAAQLVGLAGREPGALDGDAHRLFLEQRHAERLAEHALELGCRIVDRLEPLAPAQIGMDHVALDRARADDRHLDDEVVEGARLDPRQHRHLGPALDLEGAERVGLADHRVGARILGRDGGEVEIDALVVLEQVEPAPHARQHAERQHVDLHELQRVDVVLVPLDDLAVVHRRRLDRHQFVEAVLGQHEPAGVLRQVARRADQLAGDVHGQRQAAIGEVEVEFLSVLRLDAFGAPAPDLAGQQLDHVLGQAERLADVAQGTLGAVADHRRAQRGAGAAVGVVDPLDDLLAALVLEVDVDVGRLFPLLADEALEQQVVATGIDRGDAEDIAHRRVGRRAAALAQDAARAGEGDDAVHGQEVGRVFEALDQAELVAQGLGDVVGQAFGVTSDGAFEGQLFEGCLRGSGPRCRPRADTGTSVRRG